MSIPSFRLTFLYPPHLFVRQVARRTRSHSAFIPGTPRNVSSSTHTGISAKRRTTILANSSRPTRYVSRFQSREQKRYLALERQRHGKAVDNEQHFLNQTTLPPHSTATPPASTESNTHKEAEVIPEMKKVEAQREGKEKEKKRKAKRDVDVSEEQAGPKAKTAKMVRAKEASGPLPEEAQAAARIAGDGEEGEESTQNEIKSPTPTQQDSAAAPQEAKDVNNDPLETVLHMQAPSEDTSSSSSSIGDMQIPNLHTTPPYVHHFDSYTLVKGIENGGFTPDQAVTAMKAIRSLLALNLDVAKEGLVSKSDVENETYLFRAASSELRTEISNLRKAADEKLRRDRTLLQHEVDILSQKMTQELSALKDDLNGMFNDRKMAVRSEQRAMDSAIQEINYKIAVLLNSDAKSEVEGLRWVLSRRSVLAIVFMAIMVLASLRYNSYRAHQAAEEERLRIEREKEAKRRRADGGLPTESMPPGTGAGSVAELTSN